MRDLETGNLQLAVMDVASGAVRNLGGFDEAKNINPQWTADGRSLYFVSDRQGISNIYVMDVAAAARAQVTNLLTGVSGITEMSPALSVGGSRVAFSVFEDDGYNIYTLDAGRRAARDHDDATFRVTPASCRRAPAPRARSTATCTSTTAGLPPVAAEAAFPTEPYRPKLSLDFLGQPMVGVGVDSFGSYVGGGISASFSDILGNHVVAERRERDEPVRRGGRLDHVSESHAPVELGRRVRLDALRAARLRAGHRRRRQRHPGPPGGRSTASSRPTAASPAIAAYPFSRAQRLEFTGGLRQITGKEDVTTRLFDLNTGQQLHEETETLSTFRR